MSSTPSSSLERLRLAIHGVAAPFCCEGTFTPKEPIRLAFKDRTSFDVIRAKDNFAQQELLKPLLTRCKPAPFGDGRKTRYDRSVRDAFQLKAEGRAFSVKNFDPESAGILKDIQRQLLPHDPNPITAELYTVNVYTQGGHFAPHKDTPRGEGMFGTLVVCLPARFSDGKLVLRHRGIVQKFDWGSAINKQANPNQLHWVAFFGDVDHEIERIWVGARVTLTYLLRRGHERAAERNPAAVDVAPQVRAAWMALLADRDALPRGGILGYPCCHLYHQDARFQRKQRPLNRRSVTVLKGRDHLVAAAALAAGLQVSFHPYLFENCADETWQLARFPTSDERGNLGEQMDASDLADNLPIQGTSSTDRDFGITWLDAPPSADESTWQARDNHDPELPAAALLHSCDYCPWGYFGNESSMVDLYTFAALHIEIPKLGQGPRAARRSTERAPARRKPTTRPRPVDRG